MVFKEELREALMDAFPCAIDLEIMLSDKLEWKLNQIVGGDNYKHIVYKLINYADSQGKLRELIKAAKSANSGNPKLQNIDNQLEIQPLEKNNLLYEALLSLNYQEQLNKFQEFWNFDINRPAGCFLVRGAPASCQRWLLNRLQKSFHDTTTAKKVRISLAERGESGIQDIWAKLSREIETSASPQQLVTRIYEYWQNETVIIVFHNFDRLCPTEAKQLIEEFWNPLVENVQQFDLTGWRKMIDELRGRQKLVKEYDDSANGLEFVDEPQFIEQVQGRLQQVLEKLKNIPLDEYSRYESAARYIIDFSKHGQAYVDLACHAAFPLALTPDLLYYLRENFPRDRQGTSLNIPWLAIPDLLLSNLCHPAGQPLYEMDSAVRHLLLKLLQTDERFGNQRLEELSECLLFYLQQRLEQTNLDIKDFGEKPEWIALAYTKPKELAYHLAKMLEQIYSGDQADKVRTISLTTTFADPLVEEGFQPLLTFASAWGRLARGYEEGAKELFDELSPNLSELDIEGVKLTIPGRSNLPPLSQFSFDVVTVNARGKIIKREKHQANYFTEYLPDNVTLEMVSIPGGTFLMGSPETEEGHRESESPQHEVTVQPFFMGKYPITQAQWRAIAGLPQVNRKLDPDPSGFKGSDRPVENVSWYDAVEFCDRLSLYTKRNYRLPSEAEWEYGCCAGTTTPFHFGETITPELGNYDDSYTYGSGSKGRYRKQTTPVGSFKVANAFGLFDMHGNVWEWCINAFYNYKNASTANSYIEKNNDNRMLRSGSWDFIPRHCRSACRNVVHPDGRRDDLGFRVVLSGAKT